MVIGQTTIGIYIILKDGADTEELEDVGFILEDVEVLCNLQSHPWFIMLFGMIYGLNLNYPEELKCTFKVFEKILMELDPVKFPPKVKMSQ
ncbi:hypothetical protein LDENG_00148800 [Lucifuga dentata]|nr:hypothetical protein LDENG_00148800 [Lucifuga dentata]